MSGGLLWDRKTENITSFPLLWCRNPRAARSAVMRLFFTLRTQKKKKKKLFFLRTTPIAATSLHLTRIRIALILPRIYAPLSSSSPRCQVQGPLAACVWRYLPRRESLAHFCISFFFSIGHDLVFCRETKLIRTEMDQTLNTPGETSKTQSTLRPTNLPPRTLCSVEHTPNPPSSVLSRAV